MKQKKKIDLEKLLIPLMFILISLVFIIISIVKLVETKDMTAINKETTILLLLALVYVFYKILNEKNITTIFTGSEAKIELEKRKRIKNYLKESVMFSIIITLLDILSILFLQEEILLISFKGLSNTINIIVNGFISLIVAFLVSFALEYLIGEKSMKNKNKRGK